jgi:hypothetical protein
VSRTRAVTALPQSASAEAASAEAALAEAVLDSVVALASIVDSDPAPSPSIVVSDLGLASIVDSVVALASVDLVVDGKVDAAGGSIASKVLLTTDSELVTNNVTAQGGHHAPQKPAYAPAPPPHLRRFTPTTRHDTARVQARNALETRPPTLRACNGAGAHRNIARPGHWEAAVTP